MARWTSGSSLAGKPLIISCPMEKLIVRAANSRKTSSALRTTNSTLSWSISCANGKETLVLAESCTGGQVRGQSHNGCSRRIRCFPLRVLVTYGNAAKTSLLGGPSWKPSRGMEPSAKRPPGRWRKGPEHDLEATSADRHHGHRRTPPGAPKQSRSGPLTLALASAPGTLVVNHINRYERRVFKRVTCRQALELLRQVLTKSPPPDPDVQVGKR